MNSHKMTSFQKKKRNVYPGSLRQNQIFFPLLSLDYLKIKSHVFKMNRDGYCLEDLTVPM